jgi:hypothetical protein
MEKKCSGTKRRILIEGSDIVRVYWRFRYLQSLKIFREEGGEIIHLVETWLDSSLTFKMAMKLMN